MFANRKYFFLTLEENATFVRRVDVMMGQFIVVWWPSSWYKSSLYPCLNLKFIAEETALQYPENQESLYLLA